MTSRALIWTGTLLTTIGAARAAAQGPPPSPVRVAPVALEDVAERRMVTGEVRALRRAEVASQESGIVTELLVEIGMRIEKGRVIARLDDERLRLEKERTEAERAASASAVTEEEALRDKWQGEVDSLATATQRGATNARELRDANSELRQALARLERAQGDLAVYDARLSLLERRLRDMAVLAPFTGAVTRKLTEQGEWLSEGDSVCEIVQTDVLEVVLDVPQRFLPVLGGHDLARDEIIARLDAADIRLELENVRLVPSVDTRSRTFGLVAQVRNESGNLAPGLSVVGFVPTGESGEHLVVPTDAIMRNDMGVFVYVARNMGEGPPLAVPANVRVLFEMPGRVVVEAPGLQQGERVVVEGNERLFPMAPLVPSAAAEGTAVTGGESEPAAGGDSGGTGEG